MRDLNSPHLHGKQIYYHYTNGARLDTLDNFLLSKMAEIYLLHVSIVADPEGFEPSPAGSVPLTDLESAVVAVQLRVYRENRVVSRHNP